MSKDEAHSPGERTSDEGLRASLARARDDVNDLGGWQAFRSGEWLLSLVRQSFRAYFERADVGYFRAKYPGKDDAFIAAKLLKIAASNASIVGALTGAAVSADEIVALATGGEGGVGLPANVAIAATAIAAESLLVVRIQLQLVAELARLEGVPLDLDDPEDVLTILAFALGGAASEVASKVGMKVGKHLAANAVRRHVRNSALELLKQIGRQVGIKILQRNIVKYAVPGVSIAVGAAWNYKSTQAVGRIAQKHFRERRVETDGVGDLTDDAAVA